MDASSLIALLALLVSLFTFYWTSIKRKEALYLVRIDNINYGLAPEFALINSGSDDVLVTSIHCAFEQADGKGWIVPNIKSLGSNGYTFTLQPGKSHHCIVIFDEKDINENLAEGGKYKEHGSLKLYHKDMKVIVEWLDYKGREHEAEVKIVNYGIEKDGSLRFFSPLEKHHELYKVRS